LSAESPMSPPERARMEASEVSGARANGEGADAPSPLKSLEFTVTGP
jgi:hypothetical protein